MCGIQHEADLFILNGVMMKPGGEYWNCSEVILTSNPFGIRLTQFKASSISYSTSITCVEKHVSFKPYITLMVKTNEHLNFKNVRNNIYYKINP